MVAATVVVSTAMAEGARVTVCSAAAAAPVASRLAPPAGSLVVVVRVATTVAVVMAMAVAVMVAGKGESMVMVAAMVAAKAAVKAT